MAITRTNGESAVVPLRLSGELAGKLDKAVALLKYKSRNELMREALEHYIDQIINAKIVELREVSSAEAVQLIDDYLADHPGSHHVSEIAEVLGIELGTAFRAVQTLIEKRKVRARR